VSARRLLAVCVCLLASPLRPAAAPEAPSWRALLDGAEALSREGKSQEATAAARRALAAAEKTAGPRAPAAVAVLVFLGGSGDADAAEIPVWKARLSAVENKGFGEWFALGRLLRLEGKASAAKHAAEKALALKPGDPEAAGELALDDDALGLEEEEVRVLEDALQSKRVEGPRLYDFYSRLAAAYRRLGRPAEAAATFARARRAGANASYLYIQEGYFYTEKGDSDRAGEAFRSAVAVDTASPYGYHHWASYLKRTRRYAEAEKAARQALARLEADPNAPPDALLHTMGELALEVDKQGREAEAEALYLSALRRARRGDNYELRVLRSLARNLEEQGKTERAAEALERAASGCSVGADCDAEMLGEALGDLGRFRLRHGDRAAAEAVAARMENAAEALPEGSGRPAMLRALVDLYAELRDRSRMRAVYERLLALRRTMPFEPGLDWVEPGLAELEESEGRLAEAEALYRRAAEIQEHGHDLNKESELLERLAAVCEKEGPSGSRAAKEAREKARSLSGPR
jgi:tetratricopeptide (TPR) repeat protein